MTRSVFVRVGGLRRRVVRLLAPACMAMGILSPLQAQPLKVALIAGAEPASAGANAGLAAIRRGLERHAGVAVTVVTSPAGAKMMPSLSVLNGSDVALLFGGTGELAPADAMILRQFVEADKGLVVIRAAMGQWPSFLTEVPGAKRQGSFAAGAPMRVINLFPHAIFTGVSHLETAEEMPLYSDLAGDALLVIEGTVGESTAPLGWLRRWKNTRIAHIVPAGPGLFQDESYVRLITNCVLWSARRPIEGARAIVQRTYLPDAFPGALAVTMPGGPTFCFDPVRGGISYINDGDFVDLRPRWLTKRGEPARISGELFYRDGGRGLFWLAADGSDAPFKFLGYSVAGKYPELFYRVGDREIREEVVPLSSGMGLTRIFHVGPGKQALWYKAESQSAAEVAVKGLEQDGARMGYTSPKAGEFTMEIRQK
jgi:hypothetical protein